MPHHKTTAKKYGRDNNEETPHGPSKKIDNKQTPMKVDLEKMEAKKDDDGLDFVDKIWPLLEERMNTWLEVKLAEVAAATDN